MVGAPIFELPEVLLFDLGGTLVPSWGEPPAVVYAKTMTPPADPDELAQAFDEVLSSVTDLPGSAEAAVAAWDRAWRKVLRQVNYRGDEEKTIADFWSQWIHCGPVFPDVDQTLRALRERGHRLGVVSNWAPCLDETLAHLGIRDAFECVICSALVGARKPDPAIFLRAVHELGVEPHMCAYIGDSAPLDVQGARNVGMSPVLLNRGATQLSLDGCRVICSLEELLA